jgi:hypothetical protein
MTKFDRPELASLVEEKRDEILAHVSEMTLDEKSEDEKESYYETFVSFVAQKN